MKKLLLIPALLLTLALLLTACGGDKDPADTTGDTVGDTVAETAPDTVGDTDAPDTQTPDTSAPETKEPETEAPETKEPETEAPETKEPETKEPETKEPETKAPETDPPETEAPDPTAPTLIFTAEEMTSGQGYYDMEAPVLSEDGSYITITPTPAGNGTGNDPYYYPFGPTPYLEGDRYLVVKYRTEKGDGTSLQVYVGSDTLDNDNDMLMTPIVSDGEWHLAIFDLTLIDGQTSDMTGASAAAGYYDGSTVAFLRLDAMEVNYMLDEEGKPYKVTGTDGTTEIWARYDMPAEAYIDIAYLAFFSTEEGALAYEYDDSHDFTSDVANQSGDFSASDVATMFPANPGQGGSWYDVTAQYGNTINTAEDGTGLSYHLANYNEMFIKADGHYVFSATILDNADPNRNFMFVRGVRDFHFGDEGYFGHDGNNNYAGCGGIYAMVKDGVLTITIRSYTNGELVRNVYTVNVDSNKITLADDGSTVYILAGDALVAKIEISGTRDFGYTGTEAKPVTIPADACADKVVLTLLGEEPVEIADAVVAATCESDIGMAIREHGNYITFSELSIKGFSSVEIPDFVLPEPSHKYVADGLVSLYQGGEGSTWADQVGNNDVILTTDDKNYLDADGLHLDSARQYFPDAIAALMNGDEFTVEVSLKDFVSFTEGADSRWDGIISATNDSFSLYINGGTALTVKTVAANGTNNSAGRPASADAATAILSQAEVSISVTYTKSTGAVIIYINGGAMKVEGLCEAGQALNVDALFIGGVDDYGLSRRESSAVYESVRFYNRALSAEEIAANYAVDHPTLVNVALGKAVTSNNSFEGQVFFGAAQLTDGRHGEAFVATEPLGWHNDPAKAGQVSAENPATIDIDLDGSYQISTVKLIPMRFYLDGGPLSTIAPNFDLQYSTDGVNWTTVQSVTDASCSWEEGVCLEYTFDAVTANYFRLNITKDSAFNGGYTTLGEIEVYGIPA